jgi:hypothetical protein
MNEFAVTWNPIAENQLADLWVDASNRSAVTKAQAAIDRFLAADPLLYGKHLSEGLFTIQVAPLKAFFIVDQQKKLVEVERVRLDS